MEGRLWRYFGGGLGCGLPSPPSTEWAGALIWGALQEMGGEGTPSGGSPQDLGSQLPASHRRA